MTILTATASDLPGVGKKYTMQLEGTHQVVIIHHSGERETFMLADPDADEALAAVTLSDDEARKLGSVLLGADFQPVDEQKIQLAHGTVRMYWIRVDEDSPIAEGTIGEDVDDARCPQGLDGQPVTGQVSKNVVNLEALEKFLPCFDRACDTDPLRADIPGHRLHPGLPCQEYRGDSQVSSFTRSLAPVIGGTGDRCVYARSIR